MIPISKSVLIELLEGYSEEQIKAIAKRTQEKIRIDRALQLRGRYNFEVLVDILNLGSKLQVFHIGTTEMQRMLVDILS